MVILLIYHLSVNFIFLFFLIQKPWRNWELNSQRQDSKIHNASESERGGFSSHLLLMSSVHLGHLVNFSERVILSVKGEEANPQWRIVLNNREYVKCPAHSRCLVIFSQNDYDWYTHIYLWTLTTILDTEQVFKNAEWNYLMDDFQMWITYKPKLDS